MTQPESVRPVMLVAGALVLAASAAPPAEARDAEAVLEARCGGCHTQEADGLSRIAHQRKTPEGWLMTIVRMGIMHGVEVPPDERRILVKHLSDTQGLAPAEAEPYRYILERRPNVVESFDFDPEYIYMCGRCHSGARGALQRRTTEEWRLHVHFHLGQWPTTEYQFFGRDREWFKIATTETAETLGEVFPFDTPEWDAWKHYDAPDLGGSWRYVGSGAAAGRYHGIAELEALEGEDQYTMSATTVFADGTESIDVGSAILYTGYEFRARLNTEAGEQLLIGTVAEDGKTISGRAMLAEADEIGSRFHVVRIEPGTSAVMAVHPPYLKAGTRGTLSIHGTGLAGDVDIGDGVEVVEVVSSNANTVTVIAEAAADAGDAVHTVSVGGVSGDGKLTVYDRVDRITVDPGYGIARVGGGGGPIDRVQTTFEAIAWSNGPDGTAETEDDIRIGAMPATWGVEPFDEVAAALDDEKFAGTMDPETGIYTPSAAGLNSERPFNTNNAGNLKVIATVEDAGNEVKAEGQLIVTVQRWNDPPIR